MTDYMEKYREALRNGNAEKANEYYEKSKDGNEDSGSEEVGTVEDESSDEEVMEDPSGMTVSEAKDYVEELGDEGVKNFLEAEREGKERSTLVEYLESQVE